MQKKTLGLTVVALTSAVAMIAVAVGANKNAFSLTKAGAEVYQIAFGGDNGAVTGAASLKTGFVTGKTTKANDVSMRFKNMDAAEGKVGAMKEGAVYGNADPITSMTQITVVSDATAGEGVLYYGSTTGYMEGKVDLTEANEVNLPEGTNFFKIEATGEFTVDAININYDCADYHDGFVATLEGEDVSNLYNYAAHDTSTGFDGATVYNVANTKNGEADLLVIPDFVYVESEFLPVTYIRGKSSTWGIAEGNTNLENIYLPDGLKEISGYGFNYASSLKSLTLPYGLEKTGSNLFGSTLEHLRIESKNLKNSSKVISSSSKLKTIEISADVEFLPGLVTSWPAGLTVYYEGTRAQWDELAAVEDTDAIWQGTNFTPDLICSDTEVYEATFHFDNATLDGHEDSMTIENLLEGKTILDPGIPTYADNAKKFDGWYDAAEGGEKVEFPLAIDGNKDIYAHFIDYPAGYSLDNPVILGNGETSPVAVDAADTTAYFQYTAEEAEVILFYLHYDNPAIQYATERVALYDANGEEVTIPSASNNVSRDIEKIAHTDDTFVKVHFEAGETYTFALSLYSSSQGTYVAADLNVTMIKATAENQLDVAYAKEYTLGTEETYGGVINDSQHVWYTFVAPSSGGRELLIGGEDVTTSYTSYEIGTITDGVWTSLGNNAVTAYTKTGKINFEMVEGTRYYIVIGTNGDGAHAQFSLADTVIPGSSVDAAIDLTVGTQTTVDNAGVNGAYYRLNVTEDAILKVELTGAKSYSSTDQSVIRVYDATGVDLVGEALATKSYSSYNTYVTFNQEVEAGEYIIFAGYAAAVSSYTAPKITATLTTPGSTYDAAKEITPDFTGETPIAVNATEEGFFYKFTTTDAGIIEIAIDGIEGVTSTLYDTSATSARTVRGNVLRYKLSANTTYRLKLSGVSGSGTATFNMNLADTGKDRDHLINVVTDATGAMDMTSFIWNNSWEYLYLTYTPEADGVYQIESTGAAYESNLTVYEGESDSAMEAISKRDSFVDKYALTANTAYTLKVKAPGSSVTPFGLKFTKGTAENGTYTIVNGEENIVVNLDGFGGGTVEGGSAFTYTVGDPFVVEFDKPLVEPDGVTPRHFTATLDVDGKTGVITDIVYDEKMAVSIDLNVKYSTEYTTNRHAFVDNGDGTYTSGNKGKDSSASEMGITAYVGGELSFDYVVSSEGGNYDYMTVGLVHNGTYTKVSGLEKKGSSSGDSGTAKIRVEAGDIVSITYRKDNSTASGQDCAVISNIRMNTGSESAGSYELDIGGTVVLDGFGKATYGNAVVEYEDGDTIEITFPYSSIYNAEVGIITRTIKVTLDVATKTGTTEIIEGDIIPVLDLGTGTTGWTEIETGVYQSNNAGVNNSEAKMTFTCYATGKLSFEYLVGGEGSSTMYDYFQVTKQGSTNILLKKTKIADFTAHEIDVNDGDVIVFTYKKDSSMAESPDYAQIRNLLLTPAN